MNSSRTMHRVTGSAIAFCLAQWTGFAQTTTVILDSQTTGEGSCATQVRLQPGCYEVSLGGAYSGNRNICNDPLVCGGPGASMAMNRYPTSADRFFGASTRHLHLDPGDVVYIGVSDGCHELGDNLGTVQALFTQTAAAPIVVRGAPSNPSNVAGTLDVDADCPLNGAYDLTLSVSGAAPRQPLAILLGSSLLSPPLSLGGTADIYPEFFPGLPFVVDGFATDAQGGFQVTIPVQLGSGIPEGYVQVVVLDLVQSPPQAGATWTWSLPL